MNYLIGTKEQVSHYKISNHIVKLDYSISFHDYVCLYDNVNGNHTSECQSDMYHIIAFGAFYVDTPLSLAEYISSQILSKGISCVHHIDGDFVCIIYDKLNQKYFLFSDRMGVWPIYYKATSEGFLCTSYPAILFQDYSKSDIDLSSVYDFIRYGTLLGDHTFSKHVKYLNGGTYLEFTSDMSYTQIHRENVIVFSKDKWIYDEDALLSEIDSSFKKGIQKRIHTVNLDNSCVFLSGGLDSRYLLASLNALTDKPIKCYNFGQPYCEESDVSYKVSTVGGNPFEQLLTPPEVFIHRIDEFLEYTCGSDMFPQSFILDCIDGIKEDNFLSGKIMGVLLGGARMDESIFSASGLFSDYVKEHLPLLSMDIFSENEFNELCKNKDEFATQSSNFYENAKLFDHLSIQEAMQPFFIHTRDIRLSQNREFVPGLFKYNLYPYADYDFINSLSKIPPKYKLNHYFYRKLFLNSVPGEYADIPYNNTGLPLSADVSLWKQGTKIEAQREALYEKEMQLHASKNEDVVYYPHFYSDFNGYSRYNPSWKQLITEKLLNPDAFIVQNYFNIDYIQALYEEHCSGTKNHRKKIIYLLSLELFFDHFLK